MKHPIKRVAVLGSGVMGSGIAAHCANAGIPVLLLDIVPRDLDAKAKTSERNAIAAKALKALGKSKPAAYFHKNCASLVEIGNLDDDLGRAVECDLIIEAIIERLDIKQQLFGKIEALGSENTIVASNTSGLPISKMLEGRSDSFKKNFCVTHFFNPPRYMKLLELVSGPETSAETMSRVTDFGQEVLGKGIVIAKDSPNFVANRIGIQSIMATIDLMLQMKLSPEDIDNITGVPMGHPKSATFRTGDLVGIDTIDHVVRNCYEALVNDEDRDLFQMPSYITTMIERKQLGNKTRGGFYQKSKAGIMVLDPYTGEYRAKGGDQAIRSTCKGLAKESDPKARVKKLVATDGVVGEFAWKCLSRAIAYAARRLGEISDDICAIDNGMKWGFNWELGPFETWDALGFAHTYDRMIADGIELPDSYAKMRKAGIESFYGEGRVYDPLLGDFRQLNSDPREVKLQTMRNGDGPVLSNDGAEAWDLGDGILGLTFKTKANSVDPDVISMIHQSVEKAEREFRGMLVTNQGDHFCVGANLFLIAMASTQKNWGQIGEIIGGFQQANQAMKYSSIPVVAAPFGMTLGGGLEVCMGADAVQAAAETYSGLVEVGVGLIPAGAGTMNMLWRYLESVPHGVEVDSYAFVTQVFKNIATAQVATSAVEAKYFGYFRQGDGVSFERERQLYEAKQKVIGMAEAGYHAPIARKFKLPGDSGIATLQMFAQTMVASGYASKHDALIAGKLAEVLCGGRGGSAKLVSEQDVLDLEREAFLSLCGEAKTQERIQHMLMKNKPLRN